MTQTKFQTGSENRKIVFVVCPYEGEVADRVVNKFYKHKVVKYMPLGLLSVAACIRDHDVVVIDAASRGLTVDETLQEIAKEKPHILGLSAVTYRAWSMTEILKRSDAPIKIVGGPHTTRSHNYILEQGADAVFVGDAEETIPKWLKNGCPKGIFFGAPTDLDSTPIPARDLADLEVYRIKNKEGLLFDAGDLRLPMYSSKGCPQKCTYCDVQQKKYYTKSPPRIIDEFRALQNDIGATSIHILDDAFNIKKERVVDFCHLLQDSGIEIDWSVRGVVEIKEYVIKALAEAGLKRFHVGIEHLDDKVLEYFRKGHRYKHVAEFCELCDKYGITILSYFILGAPVETSKYRENLPNMIRDLGIKIPYFNVLTPLSETVFYEEQLRNGTIKNDFWTEFCQNPVKNFVVPSIRSDTEEAEVQAAVNSYIEEFSGVGAPSS